jgi:alkylhydroperoxidase family enzyme
MSDDNIERADSASADAIAVRHREQLIMGKPPRIEPSQDPEIVEFAIQSTREIRKAVGSSTPVTAADIPEFMTTLLRHPGLFRAFTALSVQLQGNGTLAKPDRQLAILRLTWLCQAPYAWGEHVKHSKRIGFSSEMIERVTVGSSAPGWEEHEQAILCAVEQLHKDAMISDPTWATLSKRLNEQQLLELPVLIGQFTTTAYLQNSVRMRLGPGNPGLGAR